MSFTPTRAKKDGFSVRQRSANDLGAADTGGGARQRGMGRLCGVLWQGPRERSALDGPTQCLLALCDSRFLPLLDSVHAGGTGY